ncbi:Uncharacterised protein [uncultured archaeon]|nr:Uncharacterised protein [uncultured archaeon]
MKKGIIAVAIIVLLIALFIVIRKPSEEQTVKDWVKKQPIIITETGETRAIAAEWIAEKEQYLLKDAEGDICYITKEKLMTAIKTETKPTIAPSPAPTTVQAPTPAPVTAPTPETTPTLPSSPAPAPALNITPTPTPTGPACGNALIEAGEQCEPPNTQTCNAQCQLKIPPPRPSYCTNYKWDGD